ncbi:MAG: endolytic transglycosylase MltG [Rhodospirillaceae bacterium]|nr:endolytic transglycosylase MltG [Rhodospirillaceae bacterium]
MLRLAARLFAFLSGLAIIAAAGVGFLVWMYKAPGPLTEDATVLIPPGAGMTTITAQLKRAGVIEEDWLFQSAARITGQDRDLRAGEYLFPAGISIEQALSLLAEGRSIAYALTVPEGLTSHAVVALIAQEERLTGEIESVPPEGSLLPETYRFQRGDTRSGMVDRMRADMDATLQQLWEARADGLPFDTPRQALILASIVEKETGVPEERSLIAGVFVNRLERGMRLETDPTVIYALTRGRAPLGRALTTDDLDVASPYNTYRIDGLPPGPICNPGRAAIEATLHPEQTDFLFFVADGTGGHAFARTLEEHRRNAAEWHRLQREGRSE